MQIVFGPSELRRPTLNRDSCRNYSCIAASVSADRSYFTESTHKSAAQDGQLKRENMQSAALQLRPSAKQRVRDPQLPPQPDGDAPIRVLRPHAEQADYGRNSAWHASALPHPETEAFLSNLCISIEEIGTRICRSGDVQSIAVRGPLQLFFVLHGQGTCVSGGFSHPVKRGMLLVALNVRDLQFAVEAPPKPFDEDSRNSVPQSNVSRNAQSFRDAGLTLACIDLSVTSAAELRIVEQLDSALINHSGDTHIWQTVELLLSEVDRQRLGARSIVESLTKNLLLLAMREHLGKMRSDNPLRLLLSEPQIARVVNAITRNPSERHTIVSLAKLAAMAPHTLSRRFEAIYAMVPNEFVLHVRLTMAEALLRSTDLPIKTIAGKVGFASRSHFSRLFSKFSGYDPTAYRLQQR
jgi:AraC-like DNA-binding protein